MTLIKNTDKIVQRRRDEGEWSREQEIVCPVEPSCPLSTGLRKAAVELGVSHSRGSHGIGVPGLS